MDMTIGVQIVDEDLDILLLLKLLRTLLWIRQNNFLGMELKI